MTGEALAGSAGRQAQRRRQRLEAVLGFLGFFTVMTFIVAVVGIVRGAPGLWPSVILLVLAVLLGLTWRAYRRA
ncbi:hypothetical protein [Tomitella biformata]|uniref:hypothetical protein n=1 Tax=Tomitella biformata TaxID=630403 RepID=UPI000465FE37|nr:hypothetical protein [Tomitella biformata]